MYLMSLIYLLLSLTFVSTIAQSFQDTSDDYILCRNCGSDISSSRYLIPMSSPVSRHAFNDTLFTKTVLIQTLSNGIFDFPVITTLQSDCVSVGEWEEKETWFPGYRWKLCTCPDCGEYIGWLFESMNPPEQQPQSFFGLILYTLIGESFTESLTKYPQAGRSDQDGSS